VDGGRGERLIAGELSGLVGLDGVVIDPFPDRCMMKNVMKRDRPMMIWLAGVPWSESAVRTKESTITMRVKLVIRRMIDGARVNKVRRKGL